MHICSSVMYNFAVLAILFSSTTYKLNKVNCDQWWNIRQWLDSYFVKHTKLR